VGYSLLTVCLGVDHDYGPEFGGGHDIIVNPISDQETMYDWIRDSEIEKMGYALLNYTAVDPSAAPAGKNTICISAMLMYDWEDEWHWNEGYQAYEDFKHELALVLVDRAEKDVLPGLSTHVEVMEVMTPQTMKGFASNPKGSIFGWHMNPEQSMNNRMPAQTPIENLLLAGAWTFPGGGQSAVLGSGLLAGFSILAKENVVNDDPVIIPEVETAGQNVVVFKKLGIWDKVKPVHLDPMYRIINPGNVVIDIPADADEYATMLKGRFPDESSGIDALWAKFRRIDRVMRIIFHFQNEGKDTSGPALGEFLAAMEAAGLTADLLEVQELMTSTSLSEFLADYISDPELIAIITQLSGFAGSGPDDVSALFFIVIWANYHLGGYFYFEGGSQSVSHALAEVIEEQGGSVRLNTRAARIDIGQDGLASRVVTDDGLCYGARYVISNANAPATLLEMVGEEYMPKDPTSLFHPDRLRWQQGEKKYPGTPLDADPPEGMEIDAITAATPGVDSARLTQANHTSGLGKSNCTGCHATAHGNNLAHYTDAQCTTCHGQNGSPTLPEDHAIDGCANGKGCHPTVHGGRGYEVPTDCRACHKLFPVAQGECGATDDYDVVIIGSGGGGLSAGAFLAQHGMSVVVIEQHHRVGGYMSGFRRGDYRFEVSLHAFDALLDEPLK
jgi:phytoene dehydrogenase-like protein